MTTPTYSQLPYQTISVSIKGHGTYTTCASHLSEAIGLYSGNTVEELQNVVIWTQEGDLDGVDDFVAIRAIRDRFHLLVMIAAISAEDANPDYPLRERFIPSKQDVLDYLDRLADKDATRLD